MSSYTLKDFLLKHAASGEVSFHMPGHKGGSIYRKLGCDCVFGSPASKDITEITGADNLFQPEGIICDLMERYRRLYNVRKSYISVGGSSAGIIAAMVSAAKCGCADKKDESSSVIIARNSHKSVFNGCAITHMKPVYAWPEIIKEYGITGSITAETIKNCMENAPGTVAVIIPSPNYYGICSQIADIAEEVHAAGKILIVDQAHGAHLKFFDAEADNHVLAAENLGADIVINSIHKTLASFTQTAVINVCSDRVDEERLEYGLQLIQSTSPSYLLMMSLDVNAEILEKHGRTEIKRWMGELDRFYKYAGEIDGLRLLKRPMSDKSKINIDMSECGVDGGTLNNMLISKGIYSELYDGNILMCMTGIGNERDDYDRLLETLNDISKKALGNNVRISHKLRVSQADDEKKGECHIISAAEEKINENRGDMSDVACGVHENNVKCRKIPDRTINKLSEQKAFNQKTDTELVSLGESYGKICARAIIPYPPGVPLILPGEVIEKNEINEALRLRESGVNVMGMDKDGNVLVRKIDRSR